MKFHQLQSKSYLVIGYGTGVLYLKCKCHFDLQLDGRCSFLRSFHSKCSLDTVDCCLYQTTLGILSVAEIVCLLLCY